MNRAGSRSHFQLQRACVSSCFWCCVEFVLIQASLQTEHFKCSAGGSCRNYFALFSLQISGKAALEKTTLRSLGLTGGSAIIRLGAAGFGLLFFLSTPVVNLFCFKYQKIRHEKSSKRQTLQHTVIIAFACLSETAAQMCFPQLQLLALATHVQIKGACLLLSFFSFFFF